MPASLFNFLFLHNIKSLMKKLRFSLFIISTCLTIPAFSQQLKLEITEYDAYCYHNSSGKFSFQVHLDGSGKMQGPLAIYELVNKNQKKDSVLVFSGTFLEGRPVGLATWYYTSGALKRKAYFSTTPSEGWRDQTCYYDVGDLRMCGKLEGTVFVWYKHMRDTAQQVEAIQHYTGGKENGVQQFYYPSGQLEREWNVAMGKRDGKYTAWYKNGKIEQEGNYKDGRPSGPWREYWENGNLKQLKATSGAEDTISNYYENGKIKNRTYYQGHSRHGDYYAYDSSGRVQTYKHFTKGEQDSMQVGYYPSGKKAELLRFKGRDKEGSYEAWYPDGKLKLTGQHRDGEAVGIWKKYDETGKFELLHYSDVSRETKAFRSGDYDENDIPEAVMELIAFDFEFTRPTINNAGQPVTVLKEDKMKFLKTYTSIDALAMIDKYGKIHYRIVTPLKPEQKETLESYLAAHFGTGQPMKFDNRSQMSCTMTVRIIVGNQ
jgi:antitoxin component YwqK of YwqJK toxin-antitoxin module